MNIGPYEIISELGRGGMGVVFRARRPGFPRDVALKVVGPTGAPGSGGVPATIGGTGFGVAAETRARFLREAQAAGRLADHPGIVGVVDVGEVGEVLYLAMDLVEGRPFDEWIAEGELTAAEVAGIGEQVARALHHAHTHGILHRDVKPGNILVESACAAAGAGTGRPMPPARGFGGAPAAGARIPSPVPVAGGEPRARLSDFGLAKPHGVDAALTRLTASGELLGTPAYMSPEQARGDGLDARADVYSLGAALYEALAGVPPFQGDSLYQVISLVLRHEPVPPRRLRPDLAPDLETIVLTCLQKDRAQRYPTAEALAEDLARTRAGEPIAARASAVRPGLARRAARHPLRLGAALGLGVVAVGGGLLTWRARHATSAVEGTLAATTAAVSAAERAHAIATAWRAVSLRTLEPMRRLQDRWHGVALADPARADALAEIAVACRAAEAPGTALPQAWDAMARCFGGDGSAREALGAIATATPDDPIPQVLYARVLLSAWVHDVELPGFLVGPTSVTFERFRELPGERDTRETAMRACEVAAALPVWAELHEGRGFLTFAQGAGQLARGDHAAAAATLAPLTDDPLLGTEAESLRAIALYLARRFGDAAAAFGRVGARGWPRALCNAGMARLCAAAERRASGADARPELDAAIADLEAGLARGPELIRGYSALGIACWVRASAEEAAAGDPRPFLDRAVATYTAALARRDDHPEMYGNRAQAWEAIGRYLERIGREPAEAYRRAAADATASAARRAADPEARAAAASHRARAAPFLPDDEARAEFTAAIAEFNAALTLTPDRVALWRDRAQCQATFGNWLARRGEDPDPAFAAGLAALDAAARLAPADPTVHGHRADLCNDWGLRLAELRRDPQARYAAAVEAYGEVLAHGGAPGPARRARGGAYVNWASWRMGAGEDPAPKMAAAFADLDACVSEDPGDTTARQFRAHGKAGWGDFPGRPADAAIADLRAAVADYRLVAAARPERADHWRTLGGTLVNLGIRLEAGGESGIPCYDEAVAALDTGLRLGSTDPVLRWWRGNAYSQRHEAGRREGRDTRADARAALEDWQAAAAADPRLAGRLSRGIAELQRAVADGG